MTRCERLIDNLVIAATVLALWQGLNAIVGPTALPAPVPVLRYFVMFVRSENFAENALATLQAFSLALSLVYAVGLSIGVWLGAHRLSGTVGEPILVALYAMPKITLYPVVLLICGLGISGKVAFGALHGILPVALLTMSAIRNTPNVFLKTAKAMNLTPWQTVRTIFLPSALPEIVSGMRIGFTTTLLGVTLAEMFASKHGLGFLMINAISLVNPEEMLSVALVLFFSAVLASAALLALESHLNRRA